MIDNIDVFDGAADRHAIFDSPGRWLDAFGLQYAGLLGTPNEAADMIAAPRERSREVPPREAGSACN
jgi:hypothetical protein